MADQYKNSVVLYLPMEGSRHGDTVITDRTGKTITLNGTLALNTTVAPPFGSTALWVDGNGTTPGNGNYATFADCEDFNLATLDFTIEGWVYVSTTPVGSGGIFGKQRSVANYGEWAFAVSSSRYLIFAATTGGEQVGGWNLGSVTSNIAIALTTWTHVAVTRKGSMFTLWINGVIAGTMSSSSSITDGTSSLTIGANKDDGAYSINGYLKDLRITKGVARYTANFHADQKPFAWDELESPRILI